MPTYRNKSNKNIVVQYTNSNNFPQSAIISAGQDFITEYILDSPDLILESEEPFYNPVNASVVLTLGKNDFLQEVLVDLKSNKIEIINNCPEIILIFINSVNNLSAIPVGGNSTKIINVFGDRINKIIIKTSGSNISKQVSVSQYKDNKSVTYA